MQYEVGDKVYIKESYYSGWCSSSSYSVALSLHDNGGGSYPFTVYRDDNDEQAYHVDIEESCIDRRASPIQLGGE